MCIRDSYHVGDLHLLVRHRGRAICRGPDRACAGQSAHPRHARLGRLQQDVARPRNPRHHHGTRLQFHDSRISAIVLLRQHDSKEPMPSFSTQLFCATLTLLMTLTPVSYTHLDVYKRQGRYHQRPSTLSPHLGLVLPRRDSPSHAFLCCSATHDKFEILPGKSGPASANFGPQ